MDIIDLGEEKRHHLYAEVNVDIPSYSIDKPFHYIIPDKFKGIIKPGMRVIVPFGPRKVEGYVLGFVDAPEVEVHELKAIEEILDSFPMLTQDLLNLSKWMAQRYVCTQAEVLRCILPTGIRFESVEVAKVSEEQDYVDTNLQRAPKQAEILKLLREKGGEMEVGEIGEVLGMSSPRGPLLRLQSKGFITLKREWRTPKARPMLRKFAELIIDGNELIDEMEDLQQTAPAQARIAQVLMQTGGGPLNVADLLKSSGAGYGSLRGLEEKGIVICRDVEVERDPLAEALIDVSGSLVPTGEQRSSLHKIKEAIDANTYETILIHGVTGSGKTEIYLQAIEHCRALKGSLKVRVRLSIPG
jgi:primosomal protein N' (replication factor Y)